MFTNSREIITLLDQTVFPLTVDPTLFEIAGQDSLEAKLKSAFDADPVEDGVTHSAEHIIEQALLSEDEQRVCGWLAQMSTDSEQPVFAASVLRCIGRQTLGTATWRAEVLKESLASCDLEIRDAAVHAAEEWDSPEVKSVLRGHSEAVSWLRDYIEDVLGSHEN